MSDVHLLSDRALSSVAPFLRELSKRFEFYRSLHGSLPETSDAFGLFDAIPSMTALQHRALAREILLQRSDSTFLSDLTSGTTGAPKVRISTARDEAAEASLCARYFEYLGMGTSDRVVALDIDSADIYSFYGTVLLAAGVGSFEFDTVENNFALGEWRKSNPTMMISLPSLLSRLFLHLCRAKAQGELQALRTIVCIGEPLTEALRHALGQSLEIECFSFYGCTETGSLAGECRQHQGLHVLGDLVVPTVRLHEGEGPCTGEILWTTLHFSDHPVVKYESGDIGTYVTEECACSLSGPILKNIRRREDSFSLFGCRFDYADIAAAVSQVSGECDVIRIEIDESVRPVLKVVLPGRMQSRKRAVSDALMGIGEFGYFVTRGFMDVGIDCDDSQLFRSRKLRRVMDKRQRT